MVYTEELKDYTEWAQIILKMASSQYHKDGITWLSYIPCFIIEHWGSLARSEEAKRLRYMLSTNLSEDQSRWVNFISEQRFLVQQSLFIYVTDTLTGERFERPVT